MALKVAPLLVTALTATSILLTACEKGVLLRDPSKDADFKVQTQVPGAKPGTLGETTISLMKAELPIPVGPSATPQSAAHEASNEASSEATASSEAATEAGSTPVAETKLWQSSITLQIKTPARQTENVYKLKIEAQQGKFSFGKMETRAGDPLITWKAICQDSDCSKLYIAAMMHFHDDKGAFRELQILMIGIDRKKSEAKRYLFSYDEKLNRFSELVKALEALEPEKTRVVILDPLAPAQESTQSHGAGQETPATGSAGETTAENAKAGVATNTEAAGQASATGGAGTGTGTDSQAEAKLATSTEKAAETQHEVSNAAAGDVDSSDPGLDIL